MKFMFVFFLLTGLLISTTKVYSQDKDFYIYLCFGQSNMEGFPGVEPQDTVNVNNRFQVLASVDFPKLGRKKGHWYTAVPPLCRPHTGLSPVDYFGRTMVANLPKNIKIGVVVVAVAGCKIELFEKDKYKAYADSAPSWMKGIIKQYDGDPYQYLVNMAKLAQKDGVIKGILLHQGESNPNDSAWTLKVKGIYDNLIKDLNLNPKQVPLLAGEVVNADEHGACAPMNKIIDKLPDAVPNSYVISSAGCPARPPDHMHFTAEGYRILGTRYGIKMLSLLGINVTVPEILRNNAEPKGKKQIVPGIQAPPAKPGLRNSGATRPATGTNGQVSMMRRQRSEPIICKVGLNSIPMSDPYIYPDERTHTYY